MHIRDDRTEKLQAVNNVLFVLGMIGVVILCIIVVANAKTIKPSYYSYKEEWSAGLAFVRLLIWSAAAFGLWVEKLVVDCICNATNYSLQEKLCYQK